MVLAFDSNDHISSLSCYHRLLISITGSNSGSSLLMLGPFWCLNWLFCSHCGLFALFDSLLGELLGLFLMLHTIAKLFIIPQFRHSLPYVGHSHGLWLFLHHCHILPLLCLYLFSELGVWYSGHTFCHAAYRYLFLLRN